MPETLAAQPCANPSPQPISEAMEHRNWLVEQIEAHPELADDDPVTGTPQRWYLHPKLTVRAMRKVDHFIHGLFQKSSIMGRSVEILLPNEGTRIPRQNAGPTDFERKDRLATQRELCSLDIDVWKHVYVDVRKATWRDDAADQLTAFARELLELAEIMRTIDGSELTETPTGGAAA